MCHVLSTKTQCNLNNAQKYFREHLQLGDYYSQENAVAGEWAGIGAKQLGLEGRVKENEFLRLCQNQNPITGELLTQRLKSTRWDNDRMLEVANRRIFYDFTFSPPKSVSIQTFIAKDARIMEAHNQAVKTALRELEAFAGTRIRKGLARSERLTGNIVCALFRHETSRALDPHLHTHCVMFNATFDSTEKRWKALSNFEMLQARKFAENVYYHELARSLKQFGYEIENKPRGDFEIQGIGNEMISRFSKRHNEIDASIEKLLKEKPELAKTNLKELRSQIAQAERSRKIAGIALAQLEKLWVSQTTDQERHQLKELGQRPVANNPSGLVSVKKSVEWSEKHLFERRSVIKEHELWSAALERGRGSDWSLDALKNETANRQYVRNVNLPSKITTNNILSCECEILYLAREGRSSHRPFNPSHHFSETLTEDQRSAVEKVLNSSDFITLLFGGAGTGKSFTLREIANGLEAAGYDLNVIAPQRQQVVDLKQSFSVVQTVAEFLAHGKMSINGVIIVDEAGQIGGQQMNDLLKLVQHHQGRVILSGDTRQHGAVEASDALRAIEEYSGLMPARLTRIRRQNPKAGESKAVRSRIKQYRAAVRRAQRGKFSESFDRLDNLGAIIECHTLDDQREKLVADYLRFAERKESTVIVSQTWGEIHEVNERVRIGLKRAGLIDKVEKQVTTFARLDLTDAQKRDRRFYPENALIIFNRKVASFAKGEHGTLLAVTQTHVLVGSERREHKIPFKSLDKFSVCQSVEMPLAKGDRLQLKANAKSPSGSELANGELVTVSSVHSNGEIRLADGRILPSNYREFIRGYAVTSYGSQGKTVEHVLFSDSSVKAATNNQQWLVTISRGKRSVKIFTLDKAQLKENVSRLGDRELAVEFVRQTEDASHNLPMAIYNYINRLIKTHRQQQKSIPIETIDLWNPKMKQQVRRNQRHGIKV
jgi:conjugative relaxase-like TrwC/TraI family protein